MLNNPSVGGILGAAVVLLTAVPAPAPGRALPARLAPYRAGDKVWRAFRAHDSRLIRTSTFSYLAHDGARRTAYVTFPSWYDSHDDPRIPLVISPHGRGVNPRVNLKLWGDLPGLGGFAVVSPEGQGRRLRLYSWGDPGQIADLARMPTLMHHELPWLHVDPRRIYAIGGSMGGQESLLLVASHPRLLAGAAAFDADTDLALRYRDFPSLPNGDEVQRLARDEIGGTPMTDAPAYNRRSPQDWARAIAFSRVPLQLWWSTRDRIVIHQSAKQSGRLFRTIKHLNPRAPVTATVGNWVHSAEMTAWRRLPIALGRFGLLQRAYSNYDLRVIVTPEAARQPPPEVSN